jgi:hypothetical protein
MALGWLGLYVVHRQAGIVARREERAGRRAATAAWKEAAEGREVCLADLAKEKEALDRRYKLALAKSRREAKLWRDEFVAAQEEAEISLNNLAAEREKTEIFQERVELLHEGFNAARNALHRAGLFIFASHEVFERGQRLRSCQQHMIDKKIDEAVEAVCEVLNVESAKVYSTLASDETPEPLYFAAAVLVQSLEGIRVEASVQFLAPLKNVVLGAKLVELIQNNNTLSLEELAPKYLGMLKEDTDGLFAGYPPEIAKEPTPDEKRTG